MATVGNLVVNLLGNTRPLQSGLGKATGLVKGFAGKFASLLNPATAALGGLAAGLGAKASLDAAREQIRTETKLAAVLKSTGHAAGLSAQQIKDYASELQGVTNFGDEATINAAAMLATFKEIKGDTFKDVLAAAQDMSAVLDTDLKSSVIQLGKAFNDPAKGITVLTRSGVSFTQQQKEQIKALQESGDLLGAQQIVLKELQSEFGGAAKSLADPWIQMKNTIGDLAENIGFALMPSLNLISTEILGLTGPIAGNADAFKSFGQSMADGLKIGIDWIKQFLPTAKSIGTAIFEAMESVGFAFRNWDLILDLAAANVKLFANNALTTLETVFFKNVGELLNWFRDNWKGVIKDIGMLYFTQLKNMLENSNKFVKAAIDFAKGKGFKFEPKGIFEGFQSSIKELPKLTKAELKKTSPEIKRIQDQIAKRELDRANRLKQEAEGPKFNLPDTEQPGGKQVENKPVAALERGSAAAFSAIQRVIRDGKNKKAEQAQAAEIKSEQHLRESVNQQKKMVEAIKGNTLGVVEI